MEYFIMNNVKWIIEDLSDTGFDELAKEVINQGMDCELVNTNEYPIKLDIDRFSTKDDCVLIQSSFQFAEGILHHKSFKPGIFLTPNNYKCTKYYKHFGDYLFNNEYVIMTVKETERNIDFLESKIGEKESGRIFIRPDSGLKPFSGMVFLNRQPYFEHDWSYVKINTNEDDLLIISSPKSILSEWRFVVVNGEVITGSLYKLDYDVCLEYADPDKDKHLYQFAQKMADIYQPDPAFTIDLVVDVKGNLKILEINSFSCAGLYACDKKIIVDRVSKLALKNFK